MFRSIGFRLKALGAVAALLVFCGGAFAAVPEYTIGQAFSAGKRSKEIRLGKVFDEHAIIKTSSYRVSPDKVRYFYFHETYGPQIRALLKGDPIIRLDDVDKFMTKNIGRISRASFYREGFVTLQLPEHVMIIPVSLVTVRRCEEAVQKVMKIDPALFQ